MEALFGIFPPYVPEFVGWTIVHSSWQIAMVAGGVFVLLYLARDRSPNLRYLIACGGLLLAAVLPAVSAVESMSTVHSPRRIAVPSMSNVDVMASRLTAKSDAVVQSVRPQFEVALPWLFMVWVLGLLLRGSGLVAGAVRLSRIRRQARPLAGPWPATLRRLCDGFGVVRPVRLVASVRADVPFVVGWLRPMIVIPASVLSGLSVAQLEAIIAHELVHVRRHDYLVNLIQVSLETLFFFHPAVWWLSAQIRAEREHCCDDLAAAACHGPARYARALLELEELRGAPRLALSAAGGSLLDRVRRLTGRANGGTGRGSSGATVTLAVLATSLLLVSAWVSAQPASDEPDEAVPSASEMVVEDLALEEESRPRQRWKKEWREDRSDWALDEDEVEAYRKSGFELTPEQMKRLAWSGVNGGDLAAFGRLKSPRFSIDEILRLAHQGVDAGDVRSLQSAGLGQIDLDEIMRLARYGIDGADVRALRAAGMKEVTIDEIVDLARHGVDGRDVRDLRAAGLTKASIQEIIDLARHGVDARDVRAYAQAGLAGLELNEMIDLARHGVDGAEVRAYEKAGLDLSVERMIDLARFGIDGNDLRDLQQAGFEELTFEQIIDLARYGVDGSDVRALREAGLKDLTAQQAIDLARYGVRGRDVKRALAEGRAKTVEEVIDLARRGRL